MKRTQCPHCHDKFKVRAAGNIANEQYQVLRRNKKGEVTQRRRASGGSKYRLELVCKCKTGQGRSITLIVDNSRAKTLGKLYAWVDREKKKTQTAVPVV